MQNGLVPLLPGDDTDSLLLPDTSASSSTSLVSGGAHHGYDLQYGGSGGGNVGSPSQQTDAMMFAPASPGVGAGGGGLAPASPSNYLTSFDWLSPVGADLIEPNADAVTGAMPIGSLNHAHTNNAATGSSSLSLLPSPHSPLAGVGTHTLLGTSTGSPLHAGPSPLKESDDLAPFNIDEMLDTFLGDGAAAVPPPGGAPAPHTFSNNTNGSDY